MPNEAPPLPVLRSLTLAPGAIELELDPADLHLGVELGALVAEADREGLVGLVAALRLAERQGSSRLPLTGPGFDRFADPLALDPLTRSLAAALVTDPERLAPVTGDPGAFRPLLVAEGCLYPQRMYALEVRLGQRLAERARIAGADSAAVDAALAAVLDRPPVLAGRPMQLSAEQRGAVRAACVRGFTLVTGGPGTGKTSILVSILRTLVRLGVEPAWIALAAPTGKAADRMRGATELALARIASPSSEDEALLASLPGARTLHRLLGFSPRDETFRHHEHDPIAASVVVVDESSMIDLRLADRLVRALPPGARLILVGDAHQLPSVDAGAVFRDLCAAAESKGAAVELTHSYRMDAGDPDGRAVLESAHAVDRGDAAALLAVPMKSAAELTFAGFERASVSELDGFLERWWERFAAPLLVGAGAPLMAEHGRLFGAAEAAAIDRFDQMERARLLSPTRAGSQGVAALNEALHTRAAIDRELEGHGTLAFGEPLLVTRNDYERNLFNGDQGLVLPVRTERGVRPSAVFRTRDGVTAYPLEAVRSLTELAWAVTVHKAQGSEYDVVALVLPAEPMAHTTRELVYTALTRARRGAIVLGSDAVLRASVERRAERFSGLAARFRGS